MIYTVRNSGVVEISYENYYNAVKELNLPDGTEIKDVNFCFSVYEKSGGTYVYHVLTVELDAKK